MMVDLDKRNLYRLPWSLNDSPVGWVEITDLCNIQCKGCYRQQIEGNKSVDQIKEEVLFMKRWRNIDNVTLAGGDPLVHPNIVEIVDFINSQGIKPFMLTNGKKLSRELLVELKRAGLAGINFHIDSQQEREGWIGKDEIELNELRQHYVDMLWEIGGIPCSFGITVFGHNFNYIPDLLRWALNNKGKVKGCCFITYRAFMKGTEYSVDDKTQKLNFDSLGYITDEKPEDVHIQSTDVYNIIKTHFPDYKSSAYLGGTRTHTSVKWLIGLFICSAGQTLGSVGPRTVEFFQTFHHLLHGTYVSNLRNVKMGRKIFLMSLFDPQVRRALRRLLSRPWWLFRTIHGLGISNVQPPDVLPNGRIDMCDSCPDITFYKGQLISSCRLDEYRKYGGLITPLPYTNE